MNDAFDTQLRDLLQRDDPRALELLYEHLATPLFAYLLALLRHRQDAEEVLHDTFVTLARERAHLMHAANPTAYVYAMARNRAHSLGRARRRQGEVAGGDALLEVAAANADPVADTELRDAVNAALAELPAEQRAVVLLKVYQQCTFADIAARLGLSLHTAASRYRYALAKLRAVLQEVRHG